VIKLFEKVKSLFKWGKTPEQKSIRFQSSLDEKLVTRLSKKRIPHFKQLKYLSHFFTSREKRLVQLLASLIIICLAFLLIRHYFIYLKTVSRLGGEYREGLVGNPRYINPILAPFNENDQDICQLIYSGLLKYEEKIEEGYKLVPDLAESYEIGEDEKTITFNLRRNVFWHDGENFTADDVVFTFQTVQNPEYKSPIFTYFRDVKVEKIDDYAVKIITPKPYAPFMSYLTLGILPKHIWENIPVNQFSLAEYNLKPIGTGLFKFKSFTKDRFGFIKSYTLEKNRNYYQKLSYLDKIVFKFYYSSEDGYSALKNKQIDGFLMKDYLEREEKIKRLNYYPLYLPQYTAIFINSKKITDNKIKKALAYSLNKEEILNQVFSGKPVSNPLSLNLLNFEVIEDQYNFSLDKAKKILEEDKWQLGEGIYQKEEKKLRVALTVVDEEKTKKIAQIIKKQWEDFGIGVELRQIAPENIQKEILENKNYQLFLYSVITGLDPDPYPIWHTSQISSGVNLSLFSQDKSDKLLEKARHTYDYKERNKDYLEWQKIIFDQCPAIFLYQPAYQYVIDSKVKGVQSKKVPNFSIRFSDIENWSI